MAAEVPLAAVIGHPVRHSLSPLIFGYLAKRTGRALHYRRLDVAPPQLPRLLGSSRELGLFRGWNCTIPHKESVARLADARSPEVAALGAANVLDFRAGKAHAYNTDVFGVIRTLRARAVPVRGKQAVVLGAGGAALAVGYALGKLGAREVIFLNRTPARARKAARRLTPLFPKSRFRGMSLDTPRASASELAAADLYVNATPLGMQGFSAPARSNLPITARRGAWAFDLIYRPEQTVFLRDARKRGLKTISGLDMLVWQALATWEIWFGPLGSRRELERHFQGVRRVLKQELKK